MIGRGLFIALFLLGGTASARPRVVVDAATAVGVREALKPAGRAVLVPLWASWCRPCAAEWPVLAPWLRRLGGRPLDVVTVALDDGAEAPAALLGRLGGVPGRALRARADDV